MKKCKKCGKIIKMFPPRRDGLPAGVEMLTKDRGNIMLCVDCIIHLGTLDEQDKEQFWKEVSIL